MHSPASWQLDSAGQRIPVACGFRLLGDTRFGFSAPARRHDLALVVGESRSTDFPTTTGSYDPKPNGAGDVYVATLTPDGKALS